MDFRVCIRIPKESKYVFALRIFYFERSHHREKFIVRHISSNNAILSSLNHLSGQLAPNRQTKYLHTLRFIKFFTALFIQKWGRYQRKRLQDAKILNIFWIYRGYCEIP